MNFGKNANYFSVINKIRMLEEHIKLITSLNRKLIRWIKSKSNLNNFVEKVNMVIRNILAKTQKANKNEKRYV